MSDSLAAYPRVSYFIDGFNACKCLLIAVWKYFLISRLLGSVFDLKRDCANNYAVDWFSVNVTHQSKFISVIRNNNCY